MSEGSPVTALLHDWKDGDDRALESLIPLVYDELKRLAGAQLRNERPGHTLSATALVHEAYVNLARGPAPHLDDRVHFYAIASRVMRRVLVWHARKRTAAKRGGGAAALPLEAAHDVGTAPDHDILALDEAMAELEQVDERLCRVVECRHFGGLGVEETATALGVSPTTVKRDWTTARAWLKRRLEPGG